MSFDFQSAAGSAAYCWSRTRARSAASRRLTRRCAHREIDFDVLLDDSGDLALELFHESTSEVGGGLTSGVALCERAQGEGQIEGRDDEKS